MANVDQNTRIYKFLLDFYTLSGPRDMMPMVIKYLREEQTGSYEARWAALVAASITF